jgi:uncharacterized delta-60 repeat protein
VTGEFDQIRGGQRSYMARLNPNGSLDESFTLDSSLNVIAGEFDPPLNCVAVQPDGKILLGGYFDDIEARLVRLNPDGTLDRDLIPAGFANGVYSLVLQPDGKILVGGQFGYSETGSWSTVIRLAPDGELDTVFPSAFNHVTGFALQPDGKVLMAAGAESVVLVRCLADGTPDPSFVSDLKAGLSPAYLDCLALQPDGQVLIAGSLTSVGGIPWNGIARLNNLIVQPPLWVTRQLPGQHAPAGPTVRLLARPPAGVAVYAVQEQPPSIWFVTNISHGGVFDRATGKVKFGPFFDDAARELTYDVFPPPGYQGVGTFSGIASADGLNSPITGDDTWVIAGPHPADITARDWRLEIGEVTAYAAAWRTGGLWCCEPNPIPMNYVTRAAALWRGGETYRVDPRITSPPLWWVNNSAPGAQLKLDNNGTSQRRLPVGFLAAEPVQVAIAASPVAGTSAYAIEEALPAGARLVSIDGGGTYDAVQNLLKWGPFLDDSARILHYEVALMQPQGGALRFEGSASFDGSLALTQGPDGLRSTSHLTVSSAPKDGKWTLRLRGDMDATYELETSTDLAHWTTLTRVTNTSGTLEIPLDVIPGTTLLYYRARLVLP